MTWLRLLWELPQTALGAALSTLVWRKNKLDNMPVKEIKYLHGLEKITAKKIYIVKDGYLRSLSSFSLGKYVFIKFRCLHNTKTIRHECVGHSKQSAKYGWLYLPVVGLPSIARNIYGRFRVIDYYGGWPENEADKLAGIVWADGKRVVMKPVITGKGE